MTQEDELAGFGKTICRLIAGSNMTRQEVCEAYRQIILDLQPEVHQGAFLAAHIMKGPTIEELAGAWDALDRYDTAKIAFEPCGPVCDIVGTGSDSLKTVNCSTPAFLIAAACGLTMAKKGARLVTGVSGATDVLELLGLSITAALSRAETCLKQYGLCYLPGEVFLKAGWARLIEVMRFTTVFNIVGPITRPCLQTNSIVIGGYSPRVCDQLLAVLRETGIAAALSPYGMVQGTDESLGMDEFSPSGPTRVVELSGRTVETYTVTPEDFGIRPVAFDGIASRITAAENAQTVHDVLQYRHEGPEADFFCMNAAACLYISGLADSYARGFGMAKQALVSGAAYEKLQHLLAVQGSVAPID